MFKIENLGELDTEEQSVVVFTREQVAHFASLLRCTEEELVEKYEGVICNNLESNTFGVDRMIAVLEDGNTSSIVVVGLNHNKFVRLLKDDEPEFGDFLQNHPLFPEINWSDPLVKSEEIFMEIAKEYKKKISEAS